MTRIAMTNPTKKNAAMPIPILAPRPSGSSVEASAEIYYMIKCTFQVS